jgi:membrane protease YdiL (CAAX protease family)
MTSTPGQGRLPPWGPLASAAWLGLSLLIAGFVTVVVYGAVVADRTQPSGAGYDGVLLAVGAMASIPVGVGVLAAAAALRRWGASDYLALTVPRRGEIVVAVIGVIAVGAVFNALLYLTGHDIVTPFQVEAYRSAKDAGWLPGLFVAIVLFAPVGEEIAFRGFLYRGWALPGRELLAIAAIAFIWALLHIQYDWLGMAQIFVIGLMLGFFRWASGSTTLAILMHALINLQAMIETAIKVEYLT